MSVPINDMNISVAMLPFVPTVNRDGSVVFSMDPLINQVMLGVGLPSNVHDSITCSPIFLVIGVVDKVASDGSEEDNEKS